MPLPSRASGSFPPTVRGSASAASVPTFEAVKTRVLIRLGDRLDPNKSRRMPYALFQETARKLVEQAIDAEAPRMARADRERLLEEVLIEGMGFGPLEELFRDSTVREVLVLGPHAVCVQRESGWLPTNVKFRDEAQLQAILAKAAENHDPVGGAVSASALDVKLGNGFRAVAVLPPAVLGSATAAVFVRVPDAPAATPASAAPAVPVAPPPSSGGTGMHPALSMGTGRVPTPVPRPGVVEPRSGVTEPAADDSPLGRYRQKVTERIIDRLARLGVYDLASVEINELRRLVAASVQEFCLAEKVHLSDSEQGRLTLEILTGMSR
jgi:hypothetical protein